VGNGHSLKLLKKSFTQNFNAIIYHFLSKNKALARSAKALFFKKGNKRKERVTCLYQLGYSPFYGQGGTRTRNTFLIVS
jgi:hypothetical protein